MPGDTTKSKAAATRETAEAQTPPPVAGPPTEPVTAEPLSDDAATTEGRQKVTKAYLLTRSMQLLGIPQYELVGALNDVADDDELTLNRAAKLHEEWLARPTTVEEE